MVESTGYIPVHGDVVWIDFNPQTGHEQAVVQLLRYLLGNIIEVLGI